MNYPFTTAQFIGVIADYNSAVWPIQIIFYVLTLYVFFLIFRPGHYSSKIISAILGAFWLWMGIVYHWSFFNSINPAAPIFAIAFVAQGSLFIYFGAFRNTLHFRFEQDLPSYLGVSLIILGTLVYPTIAYMIGHRFPETPTLGLPCPTTMFTLGALLLASGPVRRLVVIPFVWSIIGFMAAISFGMKEDVLLLISGVIAFVVILFFKRTRFYE